jgi:hypothetical protein
VYATDCDAATARLVEHGATLLSPPTDMPWGERVADLADPDGNHLHGASRGTGRSLGAKTTSHVDGGAKVRR